MFQQTSLQGNAKKRERELQLLWNPRNQNKNKAIGQAEDDFGERRTDSGKNGKNICF